MDKNIFMNELQKLNINPSLKQLEQLDIYKNMLLEYNELFNLTAITDEMDIYLKHFYDSLTITKVIDLNKKLRVLDIGTGAGFPGLVLKIFFPNLDITLIDANHKKIDFLKEVIKKLDLKSITCIHARAEELKEEYREYFDIATSRAVSHLRIIAELSIPYLKVNGYLIALKGKLEQEQKESLNTIKKLNSEIILIENFLLPDQISTRNIIKIEKKSPTDKKYPRRYDKIKKQEIK